MTITDKRFAKGHIIAASCIIKKVEPSTTKATLWKVESESKPGAFYSVVMFPDGKVTCDCKDFEVRQEVCKHIYGVIFYEVS